MAQGSKKTYTSKQKREAHDIEKGYKKRDLSSCAPRIVLCLSGDAFACALLSSRWRSETVQNVAAPRASRASTTLGLTLRDGSRA